MREFADVVGNQRQLSCHGLARDQDVGRTNRPADSRQRGAYLAGIACIFLVEVHDVEIEVGDRVEIRGNPFSLYAPKYISWSTMTERPTSVGTS